MVKNLLKMMMKEGGDEDVEGMVTDHVVLGDREGHEVLVVHADLHMIRMMTIVMIIILVTLIQEVIK